MNLCKCGCGGMVVIKSHHKYCGTPKYIHGHNRRGQEHTGEAKRKIGASKLGNRYVAGDKNPMKRPEVKALFSGENSPMKRPEVRAKVSEAKRGNKNPAKRPEVREKIRNTMKLRGISPKVKAVMRGDDNPMRRPEMRAAMMGENNMAKRPEVRAKISEKLKGRPISIETRQKISVANMGRVGWSRGLKLSDEHRKKLSESHIGIQKGEKSPRWKGGITPQSMRDRKSIRYREWRWSVFERDNFTCQDCGQIGGVLHAHHVKPFAEFPESRFEINNGITLCVPCHKVVTYGASKGCILLSEECQNV